MHFLAITFNQMNLLKGNKFNFIEMHFFINKIMKNLTSIKHKLITATELKPFSTLRAKKIT